MKKIVHLFIAAVLLASLAGCGTEKSVVEKKQESQTEAQTETRKPSLELSIESKKELACGVQEVFYSGDGGEALGENRAVVKRGEEEDWKYYSFENDVLQEQNGEQDTTYTRTISKKDLFKNSQGDSFDLECELTFNKENDEILSYSSEDNWEMASVQAVYDDHTLWLAGTVDNPDGIGFYRMQYVLYDFEADKVENVFEGVISDENLPKAVCFSPDEKKILLYLSDGTSSDEILFINGETGEQRKMSEFIDTQDRDFEKATFIDDAHVFVAQTRNVGKSAPLEHGFLWNIETNEVRQIYGEDEILAFNSEERMFTQGLGIFIIAEKTDRYRIVSADKEFLVEGVKLIREYEFFPTRDKVVLLRMNGQDIIKELGILDLKKEQLIFLEDAAALGKEYDSALWNDENSFAVNVKDGFYLYHMNPQ